MKEESIPEARVVPPPKEKTISRFCRFVLKILPGCILAMCVLGLLGGGMYGIHACSTASEERKVRDCAALNFEHPRIERIVREGQVLRAYVQDPSSKVLWERRHPSTFDATIIFLADVPEGQPLRIVSTAKLHPVHERCEQRVEVHIRSARDIE